MQSTVSCACSKPASSCPPAPLCCRWYQDCTKQKCWVHPFMKLAAEPPQNKTAPAAATIRPTGSCVLSRTTGSCAPDPLSLELLQHVLVECIQLINLHSSAHKQWCIRCWGGPEGWVKLEPWKEWLALENLHGVAGGQQPAVSSGCVWHGAVLHAAQRRGRPAAAAVCVARGCPASGCTASGCAARSCTACWLGAGVAGVLVTALL